MTFADLLATIQPPRPVATNRTENPYSLSKIDPSVWYVIGYVYHGASLAMQMAYGGDRKAVQETLAALGKTFADVRKHENGGCASCGAQHQHGAIARNHNTGELIEVGGTCAETRFSGYENRAEMHRVVNRKARAVDAEIERWNLADIVTDAQCMAHPTIADIVSKLRKYGSISERQAALVRRIADELRDPSPKVEVAASAPAPLGRVNVIGTVVGLKFDKYGVLRMTVVTDAGWRVWCSTPANVTLSRGDRVSFSVEIAQTSERDSSLGFGKRPTKARTLADA